MVKKGRIVAFFVIVLLLGSLMGFTSNGILKNIKLGLDLQGGFEILYEVKPINENQKVDRELLLSTVSALNKRVNVLGVSEPNIQIEGEDRIRVQLAGVEDQQKAREILSTQAKLTFRDVLDNKLLDGADLKEGGAAQSFGENGNPVVTLTLNDADKFGKVTQQILNMKPNNQLVIWLDFEEGKDSFAKEVQKPANEQKFLSAANVDQVLNTENVMISGNFTVEEAKELADLLNAGSLPVELNEIFSTSVGAQFGKNALNETIYAGLIGIALIYAFMIFYYRFPGVIAVITLTIYLYLTLLVFDWMNAVLTLPGIAALILGVAMAVDANILTAERIKEELKTGKSVMSAYRAGNSRSSTTIFDANITILIAGIVLFIYGTSSVKGFATGLIISILISFITAIYGSRWLMDLWVKSRLLDKKPGWFGVKKSEIRNINEVDEDMFIIEKRYEKLDFITHRKKFFIASIAAVIVGLVVLVAAGLNLGIDFASGARVEIAGGDQALTKDAIQQDFEKLGYSPKDITIAGDKGNLAIARFVGDFSKDDVTKVKAHFSKKYGVEPNISTVSPTVGKEIAKNALIATGIAAIGIVIYVAIRFEFYSGIASIIGVLFAAFLTIAIFSVMRLEVDLTFIAAVLTIVGYSINDTIVTFDRIRENMTRRKKPVKSFDELAEIVNKSIVQTLARTVNTILMVVLAAVALYLFGAESIRNFSFALVIGLLAGTYSSIFIAAQLWLIWTAKNLGKPKRKKIAEPDLEP